MTLLCGGIHSGKTMFHFALTAYSCQEQNALATERRK